MQQQRRRINEDDFDVIEPRGGELDRNQQSCHEEAITILNKYRKWQGKTERQIYRELGDGIRECLAVKTKDQNIQVIVTASGISVFSPAIQKGSWFAVRTSDKKAGLMGLLRRRAERSANIVEVRA